MNKAELGRQCGECPLRISSAKSPNKGDCGAPFGRLLNERDAATTCDRSYKNICIEELEADVKTIYSSPSSQEMRRLRDKYVLRRTSDIID